MLSQLSIKNFAILDSITLEFGPGFNVMTGETGAGKSIIVDALYFLLGDRISNDMLRAGQEKVTVEALFQVSGDSPALTKLSEWGIETKDHEILVKREYTLSAGKTRSFINGEMATTAMVDELGDFLVDIHGQHEHQAIFKVGRHRQLIDSFGHTAPLLEKTAQAYQALSKLLSEQAGLGGDSREIARRTDLLQFQVQELEAAGLENLNEEELLNKYQLMRHAEKITTQVTEAQRLLDEEGDGGVTGMFGTVVARLTDSNRLDPGLENMLHAVKTLQENLNQLSFDIARKLESYTFSGKEYQDLSDRIDGLNHLKKKYGDTLAEILNYLKNIKEELKKLLGREDLLKTLGLQIEKAAEQYRRLAGELSAKRLQAGRELAKQVQGTLKELGLPHALMGVEVNPQEDPGSPVLENGRRLALSPNGWDKVEFTFSANPGEPQKPLAKVASGGEASRVMLALKAVLSESDEVSTLIFDEIDTGVGARTASTVAALLAGLSKNKQLLCISHLAPIAAMGDYHFQVEKTFIHGKTAITVNRLTEKNRVEELAKMLAGGPVSETSRTHARELYGKMRAL